MPSRFKKGDRVEIVCPAPNRQSPAVGLHGVVIEVTWAGFYVVRVDPPAPASWGGDDLNVFEPTQLAPVSLLEQIAWEASAP